MQRHDTSRAQRARNGLFCAVAAAALGACAVGPDFRPPDPPRNTHYTRGTQPDVTVEATGSGGQVQHFISDRDIPGDWWALFQSAPLDGLVRDALHDSPTVAAAKATLRSAQAAYEAQRGALAWPALDAQLGAERERVPGAAFGDPALGASVFTLFNATVNVSYRVDLFGLTRRQLEALRAQTDYQRWELEAANLTLTGNVVTEAVNVASLRAQIASVQDVLAAERNQLSLVQRQYRAGGVAHADVLQQGTQIAQTEATVPALEKALAQSQHRLAVLAGRTPDDESTPVFDLDHFTLPTELPVSVPARLLRQRPDVQAAEALLHQATAQVGVATANLYPQLNLTGSIGTETTTTSELFAKSAEAWSIGASLAQPLFHGGELRAKRRQALADLDSAAAQYRQTVLTAMQEVADALRALESDAKNLQAQANAEQLASATLEIIKKQYQAGGVSQLAVLIAQRQYFQAHQGRVQAEATRYADTAALFQALGGGWWNRKD